MSVSRQQRSLRVALAALTVLACFASALFAQTTVRLKGKGRPGTHEVRFHFHDADGNEQRVRELHLAPWISGARDAFYPAHSGHDPTLFFNVKPGRYRLSYRLERFLPGKPRVARPATMPGWVDIEVTDAGDTEKRIVVEPLVVRGCVTHNGEPVANADLRVQSPVSQLGDGRCRTDDDGRYEFHILTPAVYQIGCTRLQGEKLVGFRELSLDRDVELDLKLGPRKEIAEIVLAPNPDATQGDKEVRRPARLDAFRRPGLYWYRPSMPGGRRLGGVELRIEQNGVGPAVPSIPCPVARLGRANLRPHRRGADQSSAAVRFDGVCRPRVQLPNHAEVAAR